MYKRDFIALREGPPQELRSFWRGLAGGGASSWSSTSRCIASGTRCSSAIRWWARSRPSPEAAQETVRPLQCLHVQAHIHLESERHVTMNQVMGQVIGHTKGLG